MFNISKEKRMRFLDIPIFLYAMDLDGRAREKDTGL